MDEKKRRILRQRLILAANGPMAKKIIEDVLYGPKKITVFRSKASWKEREKRKDRKRKVMKMESPETIEILGIPNKNCGVKRCSECLRPVCQRQFSRKGKQIKKIEEISQEIIEGFSVRAFIMTDLFTNG